MSRSPVISIREPRRKPVGFHLSDRNIMLAILAVTAALIAMTMGAERQRADSGYYGSIEPYHSLPKAAPARPEPVEPAPAKPADVHQLTREAADLVGIRPSLLHAMVMTESGGDPKAVSPKGAIGPMQLMPRTAKALGVNPHDVAENIAGGAVYLKRCLVRYRDDTLALIAYNQGPTATDRWLKRGGKWNRLPKETRDYVSKVSVNAAMADRATQLAMGGR